MFLFIRLVLAHFIADFPLQTNYIYSLKIKGHWGLFVHSFMIFIVAVLFAVPFLHLWSVWVLLITIAVLHYIIDWSKTVLNKYITKKNIFTGFIADQVVHLSIYLLCFMIPLNGTDPYITTPYFWAIFYNNDVYIIYAIFFVVAAFASTYLIDTAKLSFFPNFAPGTALQSLELYEMCERCIIFNAVFLAGPYLLLIPLALIPRFLIAHFTKKKDLSQSYTVTGIQIGLNAALPLVCGIVLQFIL
ncbi:MAG: DUF3307 domain-containing protein [Candidatus Ancaeobacter aquaticus]|nr:DUF3307 domain-containing protein [Candidatus Ancaeobacter aquaticus]